jgi:hypothetical protein
VSIALLVGGPKLLPRANDLTATEARILRAADGERQRLLLPGLKVETKQFGKKVGKHAEDFGLNPSSPADRDWVRGRIDSIVSGPEDVRQGPWNPRGGGGSDYLFYRQGADVVITKPSGDFVTVLPGGQTNGWFKWRNFTYPLATSSESGCDASAVYSTSVAATLTPSMVLLNSK